MSKITSILTALGLDDTMIKSLSSKMNGNDYMNLIQLADSNSSKEEIQELLKKYGVDIMTDKPYLEAKYDSISDGSEFDETFGGILNPLNEDFSFGLKTTDKNKDAILDWLDNNDIDYKVMGPNDFRITCYDRMTIYKVGQALSHIMNKTKYLGDSMKEDEKNKKQSVRNPLAVATHMRSGAGEHKNPKYIDRQGRKAKYKNKYDESLDSELAVGDKMTYNENIVEVKIVNGPKNTVGIINNGNLEMVAESELQPINEGVVTMSSVNPLFRLKELAGVPADELEIASGPEIDPNGMLSAGPIEDTDDLDDLGDFDNMEPIELDDELPTDSIDTSVPVVSETPPSMSDAMIAISAGLDSIQEALPDIRISEFKTVMMQIENLHKQVCNMGNDFLGE